jgi:hypothetical protein
MPDILREKQTTHAGRIYPPAMPFLLAVPLVSNSGGSGGGRDRRGAKEARENDPLVRQLDDANRRIGELVMKVEIVRKEKGRAIGVARAPFRRRRRSIARQGGGH